MSRDVDHVELLVRKLVAAAEDCEREGRASIERFVLSHGCSYERVAPGQRTLMRRGACFENSMAHSRVAGLTYVEGFALVDVGTLSMFLHGWCIDADGWVHELTWQKPGLAYFGIPFSAGYVGRRLATMRHPEHGLMWADGRDALLDGHEPDWRG